jgi:hypothetical protein
VNAMVRARAAVMIMKKLRVFIPELEHALIAIHLATKTNPPTNFASSLLYEIYCA